MASAAKRGGTLEIAPAPGQERKLRCPAARVLLGGYRFEASVSTAFLWSTVYGLQSTRGFNPSPWRGAFLNLFRGFGV